MTKNRKIILYIIVLIFISSFITLTYRVSKDIILKINERQEEINKQKEELKRKQEQKEKEIKELQDKILKEQQTQKEQNKKDSFNRIFEIYQGTKSGTATGWQIDQVIKNNKTNNLHLIEVVFDEISYGTDPEKIKDIKNNLNDSWTGSGFQEYEISNYYDSDGYINKITIETR